MYAERRLQQPLAVEEAQEQEQELELEQEQQSQFEIVVPNGALPGTKLGTTTPTGVKVTIVVPEGAVPGTKLAFTLPSEQSRVVEHEN